MMYVMFVALIIIVVMTTTIQLLWTKRQWHEAWTRQMRTEMLWVRAREQFNFACPQPTKWRVGLELFTAHYEKHKVTISRVNSGEMRTYTRKNQECGTIKTKRKKVKQ